MIPKIIHQFWDGPNQPPQKIMDEVKENYISSGWEYNLWNVETTLQVLGKLHNHYTFEHNNQWCGKSDIIRYELLKKFGGVYVDCDCKFVNLIDDDMLDQDFFCGKAKNNTYVNNNVLGSSIDGVIINKVIDHIHENQTRWYGPNKKSASWSTIGPQSIYDVVWNYKGDDKHTIYPLSYFNPIHHAVKGNHTNKDTKFNHLWMGTHRKYKKLV